MKKLLKTLMTLLAAVCAVIGGLYVYRRFFAKDEELDEVFDEDNAADDDEEEEVSAFDTEEEIFEDEDIPVQPASGEETSDDASAPEEEITNE